MSNIIQLQSVGHVAGIKAEDLQVGMRLMWNFGYTFDVISIAPKGLQSLEVVERSTEDGRECKRTLRKSTVVAGYWPKAHVK